MKQLRAIALLLVLVSLVPVSMVFAQVNFEIPLTVTDGANTTTLYMGVLTPANICIDPLDGFNGHFEAGLPPAPPGGVFDARMINPPLRPGVCYDQGSLVDFRNFSSATQIDTFRVKAQLGTGTTMTISWPANVNTKFGTMTLRFFDGSANVNINMLTNTSADVTLAGDPATVTIFTANPLVPPAPGPFFGISPASLNFGSAPVGGSATLPVTVANSGITNPLSISSIVATPPFSIAPGAPIVVTASGSVIFNVTFTPTAAGPVSGNIVFTHDGLPPGSTSPTSLPVSGTGTTQGGDLEFTQPVVIRCDNTEGFQDQLQLAGYVGDPLKALQLVIIVPTTYLQNISGVVRGSSIPSPQWNFSHVIYHFPTYDEIRVVLYGNGSNSLPAGGPYNLVKFQYGTANISGPNQTASISLAGVLGSTPLGVNAQVLTGQPQVNTIVNSTSAGDVNGDDVIDILDMLMIVDHILGRITLVGAEFTRADIAPWNTGDGVVNVQDLALLQNIILTGAYPGPLACGNGLPRQGPIAVNWNGTFSRDVKLTFHVTTAGIAVRMENAVPVKGLQLEFGRVSRVPANMTVTTLLGEGYYNQVNDLLRVLMYNMQASVIQPGEYMVGIIPFALANPASVTLERFVVAGAQNNRLENVEIAFSGTPVPELPIDYLLSQNYPNPFNPTTNIKFAVPALANVKIAIYDMLGQEVRILVSEQLDRGTRIVEWNGLDNSGAQVTSGMYIYRMTSGSFVQARKMMLLK